jgi:hypothetical protein
MNKLIGIAHSSKPHEIEYISRQLDAIKNWNSSIQIEIQDETCELLYAHCKRQNRFPTYMLLKNNIYKTHINAKYSDDDLFNWVKRNLG